MIIIIINIHTIVYIPGISCAPAIYTRAWPHDVDHIEENQANNQWFKDGVELTKMNLNLQANKNHAKNVILFLGTKLDLRCLPRLAPPYILPVSLFQFV